jgi:hypothetical protein
VLPFVAADASPVELTVATAGMEDDHDALEVTLNVVLSDRMAVALNCCVAPSTIEALDGVIDELKRQEKARGRKKRR